MGKSSTNEAFEKLKRYWLVDNHGVLTRIAEESGYTKAYVHDIFHKRRNSKDGRIEARLAKLGAPGFTTKDIRNAIA